MSVMQTSLAACPNCGRALDGAYCAGCGQKVTPINPTLHEFVHDFVHELLHVDGRIFQSIRLLFLKPGYLTREYFEGRRARHVSPIRLYLISSLVYFAAAAVAPNMSDTIQVDARDYEAAELRKRGFESPEALQRAADAAVNTWAPRAMFVLVPVFALLVQSVTRRCGRNYPQHLYFALHLHAAAFGFLTVGLIAAYARAIPAIAQTVSLLAMAWLIIYCVLAFRRAYGGTTARAVFRTAVVGLAYVVAIGVALALIVAPLIVRLVADRP